MKEIDSNREAWSRLSEDHYHTYKKALEDGTHCFNRHIQRELGDLGGKSALHLQCNTGADTILLARAGASRVTGVDLVPENVRYAARLAQDLGITGARFIQSDVLTLSQIHKEKYDLVFTSEGVLGWLPELDSWARTVRALLKEDGFFYLFDSHPFALSLDESKLDKEIYEVKYPYFGREPDVDDSIGGYACERKGGVQAYFWMHTVSEIINSLTRAGMHLEFFNEFPENFYDSGNMVRSEKAGLWEYPYNTDKYPMSFSLKATVYPGR